MLQACKNFRIETVTTEHLVVTTLLHSLNRHTEYIRQILLYYIYEKSTVQLASVGVAQAHTSYVKQFLKFVLALSY